MPRLSCSGSVAALLLLGAYCWAEDHAVTDKVDDFVQNEMLRQHIPGLSLLVKQDGKIVLAKGYGLADVELQVPAKPETVFQSGSVGKQFTATAVMMLVEEGKVGLDDKVRKYFTNAPESWADIKVRHLLTHLGPGRQYAQATAEPRPNTNEETSVPVLWNAEQAPIGMPFWYEALSLGVAGAVGSRSFTVETGDGRAISTGLHLMISTRNVGTVFSALTHLLEPLKAAQITQVGAAAEIDLQVRRQKLEKLKAQFRWYLQREHFPDPQKLKYFAHAIAELESPSSPFKLIECPLPGRLVLTLQNHPDLVFVATYEDRAFQALYQAARTARGSLDLEVLAKSSRQQMFDGAQLEGVHETVVYVPRVWAIIVVSLETAGRFLLSSEPVIAAFADFCWFIDATESPFGVDAGMSKLAAAQRMISSLVVRRPSGLNDPLRLSTDAREAVMSFRERIAKAYLTTAESDGKFLGHLPRLATQISALHYLAENRVFQHIPKVQTEAGIASVEVTARQRLAVVRTWRKASGLGQFQHDCDFVLSKIAVLGPISARELCRCCNELRMERLLPILKHLLDVGKILKLPDARLDVPQASSSRSQVQT